jgi:hypothetical protein
MIVAARVPELVGGNQSEKLRRLHLSSYGWVLSVIVLVALSAVVPALRDQAINSPAQSTSAPAPEEAGTNTDLFVMIGSNLDRPGLLPRANYDIGIGHTFGFLRKSPIGDELTFGYTYENAGTHGWFHSKYGEHTELAEMMKNFSLPKTKVVTGYTRLQGGITSYTASKINSTTAYRWAQSYTSITTTPYGYKRATARSTLYLGTQRQASVIHIAGELKYYMAIGFHFPFSNDRNKGQHWSLL